MTARRPWALLGGRRPVLALILGLVGGGATAGFAGYYLRAAWNGYANCPGGSGSGCAPHPFWGLTPELYLFACFVGVGAGVLVAAIAAASFLGRMDTRRAAYALVGLSAIGVIAYGGLGVGVAAGAAAGAVLLRSRSSRAPSPSEWSGSLPTGVPPVLRAPKRSLTDRPPVTEWDGILAVAPAGPPGRGRTRVSLPSADRLSLALARSRVAVAVGAGAGLPPVPLAPLPPPPAFLRGSATDTAPRAPRPAVGTEGFPSGLSRPAPPAAPAAVRPAAPPKAVTGPQRWQPTAADIARWAGGDRAPAAGASAAGPPAAETLLAAPTPAGQARAPLPGSGPRPLAEFQFPVPSGATTAPDRLEGITGPSASPPEGGALTETAAAEGGSRPYLAGPLRAPTPKGSPSPAPSSPAVVFRAPTAARLEQGEAPVPRPPRPTGALPAQRVRAWSCPQCKTINAPWSPRCTQCKAEAPPLA